MGRVIAAVLTLAVVVGVLWWVNDATTTKNNITCVKQTTVTGVIKYELCIAGQQPQYVSYSVWRSARVGGYYDEGTHTAYKTVDEDPHVSHGIGGDGGDGHGTGHSVGHGGGGE